MRFSFPISEPRPSRRLVVGLAAAVCTLVLAVTLGGCNRQAAAGGEVVATTTVLGDVVNELLDGTGIPVATLMPPGVDPHTYELRTADARQLQSASLVVFNGLGLEGKMGQALAGLGDRAVEAGAFVPEARRLGGEDFEGAFDPHVWMDVGLFAETVVEGLTEELERRFPEHAARVRQNAEQYQARLARLDSYARQVIGLIPEEQRVLVTAHDAFAYLGRAYGIEVYGVQGLSTAEQASSRDIEDLVDLVVSRRIPAVFVESSVNDRNLRKLVEGAQQRGHEVKLAPEIYSDSTGPAGHFEGTYLGMLDHNVTIIAHTLDAPGVDVHGHFGLLTLGHDHAAHDH